MRLGLPTSIPIPKSVRHAITFTTEGIKAGFYVQHDADGAHKAMTATSATVSGATVLGTVTGFRGAEYDTIAAELTPATITANVNNYDPPDWRAARVVRLSSDASRNITGFAAPSVDDQQRRRLLVINVGAQDIVLTHADAASSTRNQFRGPNSANVTLNPHDGKWIWYDQVTGAWRIIGL